MTTGTRLRIEGVSKRFHRGGQSDFAAVSDVSLSVEPGELLTLLGPSGCGKTTTLRMVAGFEQPDQGRIYIGDEDVTQLMVYRRSIGFVFQNYALFPHLTVFENVAYGLRVRRLSNAQVHAKVGGVLDLVGLPGYEQRFPHQLSGGEQQRVAVARAVVVEPQLLLFDEPLSNLDAKLRVQMRAEIHKLQRELGVTTIYVTHDQTEAMTMGDRVAVMLSGHLQQVDNPERLYERPANQFVAGFIGSPSMNMVEARLSRTGDDLIVTFGAYRLVVDTELVAERPGLSEYDGRKVTLGIRPEDFEDAAFTAEAPPERTLDIVTGLREALGSEVLVHFSVATASASAPDASEFIESVGDAGSIFVARVHPQTKAREGEPLRLVVNNKRLHFFDPDTGLAIYGEGDPRRAAQPSLAGVPR